MYEYRGIVTKVVDGDTVDIEIDLGFYLRARLRFRLNGIDCAEMNEPNVTKRQLGKEAKLRVIELCLDQEVIVKTYKADSFGRWLCEIYIPDDRDEVLHLNALLVEEGLADKHD